MVFRRDSKQIKISDKKSELLKKFEKRRSNIFITLKYVYSCFGGTNKNILRTWEKKIKLAD